MLPLFPPSNTMLPALKPLLPLLPPPMKKPGKNIAVLGSTGSIGQNALEVIANSGGELVASVLSAHNNVRLLQEQAIRFKPRWIVASDPKKAKCIERSLLPSGV